MKKVKYFIFIFLSFLVFLIYISSLNTNADVLSQGIVFTDEEYQELLDSVPENAVLLSNEKYEIQQMLRTSSGLQHQSHIQDYGWSNVRNINSIAGVTGQGKRLEALKLSINNLNTNVYYRFHIQDIGWESWKSNWATAGTLGRGLRTEAIQITTTGRMGVSYRVHVQGYGWLRWLSSFETEITGAYAGTTGQSRRIEAIQFQLYSY